MRELRNFHTVTAEYYKNHPEEVADFIKMTLEEYDKDNDIDALLSALRIICEK